MGCVFGCVWRVPWLLGGFLGERGERVYPPVSFLVCSFGGVTSPNTAQKIFMKVKGSNHSVGICNLYIMRLS